MRRPALPARCPLDRLGACLAAGLAERAEALPVDVLLRLQAARQRAAEARRRVPAVAANTLPTRPPQPAASTGTEST
jgi:hypothetical protein